MAKGTINEEFSKHPGMRLFLSKKRNAFEDVDFRLILNNLYVTTSLLSDISEIVSNNFVKLTPLLLAPKISLEQLETYAELFTSIEVLDDTDVLVIDNRFFEVTNLGSNLVTKRTKQIFFVDGLNFNQMGYAKQYYSTPKMFSGISIEYELLNILGTLNDKDEISGELLNELITLNLNLNKKSPTYNPEYQFGLTSSSTSQFYDEASFAYDPFNYDDAARQLKKMGFKNIRIPITEYQFLNILETNKTNFYAFMLPPSILQLIKMRLYELQIGDKNFFSKNEISFFWMIPIYERMVGEVQNYKNYPPYLISNKIEFSMNLVNYTTFYKLGMLKFLPLLEEAIKLEQKSQSKERLDKRLGKLSTKKKDFENFSRTIELSQLTNKFKNSLARLLQVIVIAQYREDLNINLDLPDLQFNYRPTTKEEILLYNEYKRCLDATQIEFLPEEKVNNLTELENLLLPEAKFLEWNRNVQLKNLELKKK